MEKPSSSVVLLPGQAAFQGKGQMAEIGLMWEQIRNPVIVPFLRLMVFVCLAMSTMLFVERVYMGVVIVLVKIFGKKPMKRYKWEPMRDDLELGNSSYPMVLVQIPMYNEREVYQLSIGAACGLSWPSDRIIIQVLDDSTDPLVKVRRSNYQSIKTQSGKQALNFFNFLNWQDLVETECGKWSSKGVQIKYEIRNNRTGYKAGALKEGLKRSYVKQCDYVVIFDADFQPEPDYLLRAIPFLAHNPEIALVQARWKFGKQIIIKIRCHAVPPSFIKCPSISGSISLEQEDDRVSARLELLHLSIFTGLLDSSPSVIFFPFLPFLFHFFLISPSYPLNIL